MLASPSELRKSPASVARGWPVEAWTLNGPDFSAAASEDLEGLFREIRGWDSSRRQAVFVGEGASAEDRASIGDVLILGRYPVPQSKLESAAEEVAVARRHLPRGKPLWATIQAFDRNDYPQGNPNKPGGGRFPAHFEIRFMSYLAILQGAEGLFYYTFKKPGGRTLADYPELWQAVARVAFELKGLQEILERGKLVHVPFPPDPDGPRARAWRYRGRDYVVVVNPRRGLYQKIPDQLLEPSWRPVFEVRRDPRELLKPLRDGWYLRPYQVMVFESRPRWIGRKLGLWRSRAFSLF